MESVSTVDDETGPSCSFSTLAQLENSYPVKNN